ncbi:hypothetical protein [Nocardia altamirensis]|uniref:hypothetical protein n=1 Tax=Nocardia altamirensis TaxID=472158 RepID=UPI00114CBD2F|nr:hypothetical protein [Nocardia altamirensis]
MSQSSRSESVLALLDAAAAKVQCLHAEQLAAEEDYIRCAAAAHEDGHLDWRGLTEVYERIRAEGRPGYSQRWLRHIPHDLNSLRRFAAATPNNSDGTWSGESGWEGLDKDRIPTNGTHVAYALFGNAGAPIHISFTYKFRSCVKRLHESGLEWVSWKAWPASDRKDAVRLRRQLAEHYNWTNVAESSSESVPESPTV